MANHFLRRQIKAARALLDWSQTDLAEAAGVSRTLVKLIEIGESRAPVAMPEIIRALERKGVRFTTRGIEWCAKRR